MKLQTEKNTLASALAKVVGIVEKRNTMPILSNVLIETVDEKSAVIRATDLDIEATATFECDVETQGAIVVSAETINGIVRSYDNAKPVSLSYAGGKVTVSQGRSRFDMQSLDVQDFPRLANDTYDATFEMSAADIARLFGKTAFAQSTEETRYYLNGVYFHNAETGITAVSTDGHRLAKAWIAQQEEFTGVIVPRKTVAEVRKAFTLGNVQVSVSATKIRFDAGDVVIVSKVVDGSFPDYSRVIPVGNNDRVRVSASDFAKAANRVALASSDKVRGVALNIGDGSITFQVQGALNAAEDAIDADTDGAPARLGFNSKYLAEVLSQAEGGDVVLKYNAENNQSPALICPTEDDMFLAVVMPMRV